MSSLTALGLKELVTFTSGSGMGKSQIMTRAGQHYLLMNQTEDKIGILST